MRPLMRRMDSASTLIPSAQLADPEVADRERTRVIALDADEPARRKPVFRVPGELARGDALLPVLAPEVVLDDFDSVQPVLDVIAAHEEPRPVPLIVRLRNSRRDTVERVVGPGCRERVPAILGVGVVEQLVLGRTPVDVVVLARAAVKDTAVAALADLPLELELEVAEAPVRY